MIPHRMNGPLIACLLLSLTGCGSPQIRTVIQLEYPPDSLLIDTPIPVAEGRTNADLMNWANSMRCAVVQANEDKAALRAWKKGLPYAPGLNGCDNK